MPFLTLFLNAFCGDCEWGEHVEDPTPAEQARIIRQTQAHRAQTGHNACLERGQTYANAR